MAETIYPLADRSFVETIIQQLMTPISPLPIIELGIVARITSDITDQNSITLSHMRDIIAHYQPETMSKSLSGTLYRVVQAIDEKIAMAQPVGVTGSTEVHPEMLSRMEKWSEWDTAPAIPPNDIDNLEIRDLIFQLCDILEQVTTWKLERDGYIYLSDTIDTSTTQGQMYLFLNRRYEFGKKKYGTSLHTNNGRNALLDLMEELGDALVYATQVALEYEESNNE